MKNKEYIEILPKPEIEVKFNPNKHIWVIESKNFEIAESLIKQYGKNALMIEVIDDLSKKFNKEEIVLC